MTMSLESFLDELEKISAAITLTPEEKSQQMLQFAGTGAATYPAVSALASKIQSGRWLDSGAKSPSRWLAGKATQGLLFGGALPAIRHAIERANVGKARSRMEAEREMVRLAPGGVQQTLQSLPEVDHAG
jgi:hypothetical protein